MKYRPPPRHDGCQPGQRDRDRIRPVKVVEQPTVHVFGGEDLLDGRDSRGIGVNLKSKI